MIPEQFLEMRNSDGIIRALFQLIVHVGAIRKQPCNQSVFPSLECYGRGYTGKTFAVELMDYDAKA